MQLTFVSLLLLSGLCLRTVTAGRVLLLVPFGSQSHKNLFSPLAYAIGAKGHRVTLVSLFQPMNNSANVEEVIVTELKPLFKTLRYYTILEGIQGSSFEVLNGFADTTSKMCELFFESKLVQDWVRQKTKPFDVVIIDGVLTDCVFPLGHLIADSVVAYNTAVLFPWIAKYVGCPYPYAIVPNALRLFNDRMSFWQRISNTVEMEAYNVMEMIILHPYSDATVQKYFPGALSVSEAYRKMSMVFASGDSVLVTPRPMVPNIINIGGIHCRDGQPLPKDLEEFATKSADVGGFIIFSLGSIFEDKMLTDQKKQNFITALSTFKYNVLWKNDAEMPSVPKNIKVVKWFPQQDLLAHPNCRAFITHGGLLSLQESLYHRVPMVVIPLFADQPSNAARVDSLGIGKAVDWNSFTSRDVIEAVEYVTSPEVRARVEKYSDMFKDRPFDPADIAVHATEKLIKFKNIDHLLTVRAKDMGLIEYLMIDIIILPVLVFITIFWISIKYLKTFYF